MIRPFTCLAFLLACGSGLYLYQSKHRVTVLDDRIAQTVKSTDALREQTRMLSAEWTLLNDPERLRQLATQFLTLQTVSPNQFTSLADLDSRLPASVPPGTPGNGGAAPPPSDVPVALDDAGRTGVDEGRPGGSVPVDAKIADASSVAPKPAAAAPAPTRVAAAAPLDPAHPAESKPVARVASATPPRPVARPPEQRVPSSVMAEERPMAPPARIPVRQPEPQAGGSFLGMAHGMASPPAPLCRCRGPCR
jgi:hypothetical protein